MEEKNKEGRRGKNEGKAKRKERKEDATRLSTGERANEERGGTVADGRGHLATLTPPPPPPPPPPPFAITATAPVAGCTGCEASWRPARKAALYRQLLLIS
ncbi:hypothetical protein G5I_02963 [Acromyrmex echinatior]|uniref:Uncharacterized protein n=1 Tax=Acromyrmex echinatior TaxID=103372 RepID=F4WBP4_ACREC|nr:hypothetical protein G5I_02963 [Acromyrmex echinatior]